MSRPSPELRARVLAAVRAEPVPSRPAGTWRSVAIVALGLGSVVLLGQAGGGPQLRERPLGYVVALALVWLPIATLATWAGFGRGRSMLGRPAGWSFAVAVGTPAALLVTWLGVAVAWPETMQDASGGQAHLVCLLATLLLSVGPLVAFFVVRRGGDPVAPHLSGAATAAAAGAWGAAALPLFCGFTAPLHIAVGHVLPVALMAALGALLGGWVFAVRAR
ncbi:MAG TPA: NrsF family protein [Polyangiaceae bacterium]|nr:NrsF family protein [Polyangiaceae bacterium]